MKKVLFIAVFAFIFSNTLNAQDEATKSTSNGKDFSFGVKAGVNLATISNVYEYPGEEISGRTSFHVGVLGEYSIIEETFSVQAEILYSELGAKYEYNESFDPYSVRGGGSYSEEGTVKLNYISIPILAKYYFIPGFSVEAGPQFGFNVSAKYDYESTYGDETESDEINLDEDWNKIQTVDIGAVIGLTYELDFGLFFSARYVFGLSKVSNVGDDYIDDIDEYYNSSKNNVFQASAGYKFN